MNFGRTGQGIKKQAILAALAVLGALCFCCAPSARADIFITATEVGGNTIFSYNGTLDTAGLTQGSNRTFGTVVDPANGSFGVRVSGTPGKGNTYVLPTPIPAFGTGAGGNGGVNGTGTQLGLRNFTNVPGAGTPILVVPSGFTSGPISGTATIPGDFATVVGTPIGVTYTLPNGEQIFFFGGTPPPTAPTIDFEAIHQFLDGAVPLNRAVGQVASKVHDVSTRGFGQRIFRVRSRTTGGDTTAGRSGSRRFEQRGREVAASRFSRMQGELSMNTSINLNGVDSGRTGSTPQVEPVWRNSDSPFGSTTWQAGATTSPGVIASGQNWEVFASADFGRVEFDNLGGNPALESNSQAATFGFEIALNDNLAVGGGWSHLWNDNDLAGNIGSIDVEGDAGVVYATYFKNNFWGDLLYSYGNYEAEITRNVPGAMMRATPEIESHLIDWNMGYNFAGCDGMVHGPTFRTAFTTGTIEGYTEAGAPRFAGQFAEQDYESLQTVLGWQFNWQKESNFGVMRPQLRVGYGREHLDQDERIAGALVPNALNNNTAFGFGGNQVDPGEGWLDLGAGVSFQVRPNVSLYLDYNGQFLREDVDAHFGTVRAAVGF